VRPKTASHHRRWTLRLFEWGVLTAMVLVLMGVFLGRVRRLQVEVERLNVQATVDSLRTAVLLAAVGGDARGRTAPASGGNPVRLLREQTGLAPAGYLGELDDPDPAAIAPGSWYFDRRQGFLIYRVRRGDALDSPLDGPPRLRWRLVAPTGTRTDKEVISQVRLKPCEPSHWRLAGAKAVR
jgi:general secretion pathway protein G